MMMEYRDILEQYAEGLSEEEFEKFWKLSPGKQAEQMVRAGVLYD
tara:strand:- start:566 stop:700 length:135 start_codon:yes stop_codon:yes gene_type:complete